jgi:hypothetical protein
VYPLTLLHSTPQGAPIRMLLRISFTINGQEVVKQHQVGQFPAF